MTVAALERVESPVVVADDVPNVYLYPGRIFTSVEPMVVSTILGSCVAVCLWDPSAAVGGINHYLLPSNPSRGASDPRYGDTAMTRKIVGGASLLDAFAGARKSIGDQNVAIAREFLSRLDIRITGDQTGGRKGRKLLFHTGNGTAYVKEI
jgi:chemotaxis protein CheD